MARRSKRGGHIIRAAFVVDPWGSVVADKTGEEETAEYIENLTAVLRPAILKPTIAHWVDDAYDGNLLVFDFGGMSPGNDLMASNSRAVIRWAENHPAGLVLVMSTFTYTQGIEPELVDRGLRSEDAAPTSMFGTGPIACEVSNIWIYSEGHVDAEAHEERIRQWFGVNRPR